MKPAEFCFGAFGVQQQVTTRKRGRTGRFDLFLTVAGWESRASFCARNLRLTSSTNLIVRFASTDDEVDKKKDALQSEIASALASHNVLTLKGTLSYRDNCAALDKYVTERYREIGRPLRIAVDISSLPKMYIAFLIACLFRRSLCAKLSVFYSEAQYQLLPTKPRPNASGMAFSIGEWETVEVPYIEASPLSGRGRNLIISVGAEIRQARAHAQRFEPNDLNLLGVANEERRLKLAHVPDATDMQQYFLVVREGGGTARFYELGDVGGVAAAAIEIIARNAGDLTRIFAVGCKPHTVAMTIVALAHKRIELVCRRPGAYARYDAIPIGPIHRFDLLDRFEPFAYLV